MNFLLNKKIIYLLLIFVFTPACLYFAFDRENIDINEFRIDSGYQEVSLSDGITSYKDIGDKDNKVIEGNPNKIKQVTDYWKFTRNILKKGPNWYLTEIISK